MKDLKEKLKTLASRLEEAFRVLNLEADRKTLEELQSKASSEGFWGNSTEAQEVMQAIGALNNKISRWDALTNDINDLEVILADTEESDQELLKEIENSTAELELRFDEMELELLFRGKHDSEKAILSISAGSGGVDAQDWAEMLLRMYIKFAETNSLKATVLHHTSGEEAGIKSASLEISGDHPYGRLKSEHGVHRLVRISPFDADKARHTSFALVEVVPEIKSEDYTLDEKDLRIDVFRSGGHGGQSVNTTDSAVRITHIPTGITATCQNERSQLQNKELALTVLRAKLISEEEKKQAAELAKIKGDTISAEWGNQIRSYVLQPYTLVKDHRTAAETADVQKVLDGDLTIFIEAYLKHQ